MKKKNIFILMITLLLSLCACAGLLIYAFWLQVEKDQKELKLHQNGAKVVDNNPVITPTATVQNPEEVLSGADKSAEADTDPLKEDPLPSATPTPTPEPTAAVVNEPIVLAFAGDINLDESSYPVARYDEENKGILGCISEDLINDMNAADIMMLNNEFAYSTRGAKLPNKSYTFRAHPDRVNILKEMGVDIVSLANNHALDYGPDALVDTFATLDAAGIDYVGAGDNLDRAKAPIYYSYGDKTIAYVAASRVVYAMDWYASEDKLGMVGTYDPTLILESIREAKENSDFVVIYVHWGVEREHYPVKYQRTLAKQYIDAGADLVVGCHPHVMQGFEYYKGKLIAYSLGNFWFNRTAREAGLLKLYLDPEGSVRAQFLPTMGKDAYTSLITDENERSSYYDFLQEISYDINIDENGFITEAQ